MIENLLVQHEVVAKQMSSEAFEYLKQIFSSENMLDNNERARTELKALGYLDQNGGISDLGRLVVGDKRFVRKHHEKVWPKQV